MKTSLETPMDRAVWGIVIIPGHYPLLPGEPSRRGVCDALQRSEALGVRIDEHTIALIVRIILICRDPQIRVHDHPTPLIPGKRSRTFCVRRIVKHLSLAGWCTSAAQALLPRVVKTSVRSRVLVTGPPARLSALRIFLARLCYRVRRRPRGPPTAQPCSQGPDRGGPSRLPGRCPGPPPLGGPRAVRRRRAPHGGAHAGVREAKGVRAVAPRPGLTEAGGALTRRGTPPPPRGHSLTQAELAPCHTGGLAVPAAGRSPPLPRRCRAAPSPPGV